MFIKRIVCRLYAVSWGVLRIFSFVLLSIYGVVIALGIWHGEPWVPREKAEVDPIVCGRMSGVVYQFPRLYFPFWPEYEGKSSFDPDFGSNKKGCKANFSSIFLSMSWPALSPADDSWVFRQGLEHEGLLVSMSPIVAREGDLRNTLDWLLGKPVQEVLANTAYDEVAKLYRVEMHDRVFEDNKKLIYWGDSLEEVTSVGFCDWRPREPNYYSCHMSYVVFGDVLVEVIMRPDKLGSWSLIMQSLKDFLVESRK
ncbi:hypothetical protein [Pseudomonas sp. BP8]|uniref:hypothetical protein n=1 Tax=Pseudomonas sp. BP8 TaxID=2817864 RepID=UPI001AE18B9B|nr:hypothetical protein [Pseudomonas sp. BP8]MBP2260152.1 hypothetical protein [Pseudomonas sp. BP8]HDS1736227.1 hypothetical protein [Pseudomonas putida]